MRRVEIAGLALEPTTGAPLVVLRETEEPHRVLPIFVGGAEAAAIALALEGQTPPRPLTYDLMATLVQSLDVQVERVEVTQLRDGAFFAELALNGAAGGRRLDTRPSDAIALALRLDTPLFVSAAVLDEVGAVLPDPVEPLDAEVIDKHVADFRLELDSLDLTDFGVDSGPRTDDNTNDSGS